MQNEMPNLTKMIGMPCSHSKIMAATTTFFLAVFRLAEFFFPAAFRLMPKIFGFAVAWGSTID